MENEGYWHRRYSVLLAIVIGIPLLIAVWAALRFLPNRAVTYANIEEHFKYGSTGGYQSSGFPYWIWKALPVVFKDKLPKTGGEGYESFGMGEEKNADGTKKDVSLGMPAARFDLGQFEVFLCTIASDERFDANDIVPEIERQAGGLSPIDKYVIYPIAISLM